MLPRAVPAAAPPRPYTVSELLAEVTATLRRNWRDVAVVGEIGRFDRHGGHGYFTLKDGAACLPAVIFASELARVPFQITPGLEVVARGCLELYAPQGKFQLKAWSLEPVGTGALQLAFAQLKERLAAEGLFDPARKRRIPLLPRSIGIVTSPGGAAIRDILQVLSRRFDTAAVTIYPVRVQGEGAAAEIVRGIRVLNQRGGFDVLLVARGGGSIEDLAPFNDERVARALAASRIPTISAVGHETDFTIADLVADLRAPTPSAAAELVIERKADLSRRVVEARARLLRAERARLRFTRTRLKGLSRAHGLLRFGSLLRQKRERVAQGRAALVEALERRPREYAARLLRARSLLQDFAGLVELPRKRERIARLQALLSERARKRLTRRRERLRECAEKLRILDPLAVLARGYAVAFREGVSSPLLSAEQVRPRDRIRVRLHQGEIRAVVRKKREVAAGEPALPLFEELEEKQ
jgi:exodeoxyribonuclease VII large subunit